MRKSARLGSHKSCYFQDIRLPSHNRVILCILFDSYIANNTSITSKLFLASFTRWGHCLLY